MYLKSIELQGFKSFSGRTVFAFHNGITAIVGPNGSGKSNVADAVRWVLGEQSSRQLRGNSMQDVIFAGTEQRKPLGFAYVAITLDNSDHTLPVDYDEVVISRRLYRSGESEYKLNQTTCRLRDIQELFYDTGIGKEGYSIIGQGQIDQILNGRPEERRELFDEAAGIVKFKRRKVVTRKKLDDEEQNLIRINDILSELEKQAGPLKKQAEEARKYLSLREEMKKYDANLFLLESGQTKKQLAECENRAVIVRSDMTAAKEQAESSLAAYEACEKKIAALDETLLQKRSEANQAEIDDSSLKGQIAVLEEQIRNEELQASHIKERLKALQEEIRQKEEQQKSFEQDNGELLAAVEESRAQKQEAEQELSLKDAAVAELEKKSEETKTKIISLLNEKADLSASLQRFTTMLEQAVLRRAEITKRLLKSKSEDSALSEELKAMEEECRKAAASLKELEEKQLSAESGAESLELEAMRLSDSLEDARQSYRTAKTRHDSLLNLAERYEGYGNATQKIMELRSSLPGILGVVADCILTEKKYETAIETALGGSLRNIVTDNENTAKECIGFLKKNKLGRQTFLPLSALGDGAKFAHPEALKEKGVIGLASTLVTTGPDFRVLADSLLGRVLVVDNVDHAIALARKYRHSIKIVTLEGELFSAGGSMSGGAYKNSGNLLGRRRELEELEKACEKAQARVDGLTQALSRTQASLAQKREESKELSETLRQESLRENTLRLNLENRRAKQEESRGSDEDLTLEEEQLAAQIAEISEEQESLRLQSEALQAQIEEQNAAAAKLGEQSDLARKAREEASASLEACNLKASSTLQQADFVLENIRRIGEETEKLKAEAASLTEGQDPLKAVEEKRARINALKEAITLAAAKKEQLEAEVNELTAKREAAVDEQKEALSRREEAAGRSADLEKDLLRIQNQKEKLEEKQEARINTLWEEYELTPLTAGELRMEEPMAASQLRHCADECRQKVRGLGTVNVNAIEDYRTVSERLTFLKTQHDDIEQAAQALTDIIKELDTGMRRQFEERFEEIRKEFNKVFRELFGGGSGTLALSEGEDILEAGVQIIAQPPGKKLQNMLQLSGGEKALTAIALLFAIQSLKPSPFCLLDEIEAALDESNVDRFAQYLKKLSARTQFIVITHRRGTMVAADRLYGITMEEKGISALVSVSLIEDQLDA